jgi:hypothetical protein
MRWPPLPRSEPAPSGWAPSLTIAATTVAADFTGIILASVMAAIGFFILPAKRQRAKERCAEDLQRPRAALGGAP